MLLQRCTAALTGVLLSLKRNPIIRYDNASPAARQLAEALRNTVNKEQQLFADINSARHRQVTPFDSML